MWRDQLPIIREKERELIAWLRPIGKCCRVNSPHTCQKKVNRRHVLIWWWNGVAAHIDATNAIHHRPEHFGENEGVNIRWQSPLGRPVAHEMKQWFDHAAQDGQAQRVAMLWGKIGHGITLHRLIFTRYASPKEERDAVQLPP